MSRLINPSNLETTDVGISSLMDTWLLLRVFGINGERNRGIYVLKSRGMAHSNQVREFRLSRNGVELYDVYVGPEGALTGSARLFQEKRDRERQRILQFEAERQRKSLESRRKIPGEFRKIHAARRDRNGRPVKE